MRMYDIIKNKRDGKTLTPEEIAFAVRGYSAGTVPDAQMSALCMAIFFRGMTDEESAALTGEMARSGEVLDLSCFGDLSVDKHSTGGVGDKTSLVLSPICAALGMKIAKMSGRGLGHTGGTVDKLESIPGYRTELSPEEFISQVERIGVAVCGQSAELAPADKRLYRLRDECAEVESLPLIASSIMSKKLAAGAKNIVLDVKCGSGAFMKTADDAARLGELMVRLGRAHGRNVRAIVTDMDTPLGLAIGNALEVNEAVDVLRGGGPRDLRDLCVTLASELYEMSGRGARADGFRLAEAAIDDGAAYDVFIRWISAQGGDPSVFDGDGHLLVAPVSAVVRAERDGRISRTDSEKIGTASLLLGAGRAAPGDAIDHSAGIVLCRKAGELVKRGDELCVLYSSCSAAEAEAMLREAIVIGDAPVSEHPLIIDRIG